MRTVGVVTVGRSDYGIYRPALEQMRSDPALEPLLFVGGMHLAPEFGRTIAEVEADGYRIVERVEHLLASDSAAGVAASMGLGTVGFAQAFARTRPDLLLVLGDRFEMHAAVVAALPFRIPVAHLHGGESTEGLIDEAIRHSITKMSHLHFAATELYARRIVQMGEEPWRVTVTGALGLDNIRGFEPLADDDLAAQYGIDVSRPMLLVTFHPVTLEFERAEEQAGEVLAAIAEYGLPAVFTYPNADTGHSGVASLVAEYVRGRDDMRLVANLGTRAYFTLMSRCAAMVGNSSSGIIEAASFHLPVVNVGIRQQGRLRPPNVLDCPPHRAEILAALRRATSDEFRRGLDGMQNPYGDGHAAERVVETLRSVEIDDRLLVKRFHDVEARG